MNTLLTDKETHVQLSQLDQLKTFTKVVADTADFESIREFSNRRMRRLIPVWFTQNWPSWEIGGRSTSDGEKSLSDLGTGLAGHACSSV
jgi:hypothetical protein